MLIEKPVNINVTKEENKNSDPYLIVQEENEKIQCLKKLSNFECFLDFTKAHDYLKFFSFQRNNCLL